MRLNKRQKTKEIGELGEKIACKYLKNRGFSILERNYWRKWGELDIVASSNFTITDKNVTRETKTSDNPSVARETTIHFIEVKTLSYDSLDKLDWAVAHETWRPEEQVHKFKLHQIKKAVETWISENNYTGNWQIDVIAIRMVPDIKLARVKMLENIGN